MRPSEILAQPVEPLRTDYGDESEIDVGDAPRARFRHAAGGPRKARRRSKIPFVVAILVLAALGVAAWFIPADLVPLPKSDDVCVVTGGGTVRVETGDCGMFYYRGKLALVADKRYAIEHTGPIAWHVRETTRTDTGD